MRSDKFVVAAITGAVTAVFSIMATVTVTWLTMPEPLSVKDVERSIDARIHSYAVTREEVIELLTDKALTKDEKEIMHGRLRMLEQQTARIETKMDLLLSREGIQVPE